MKCVCAVFATGMFAGLMAVSQQPSEYHLTANLPEVPGTATTDKGNQRAVFFGSIGFRVVPTKEGLLLYLFQFNLVSKGVPTEQAGSGVFRPRLLDTFGKPMGYDPRSGQALRKTSLIAQASIDWSVVTRLNRAQFIKIQPVFIGTGPTDPGRTGMA